MENSILKSTKKMLGLDSEYTAFDVDVIMHINSTFSVLTQMGVGPEAGFMIEDESAVWDDFIAADNRYNNVKTYMYLKVRTLFDPPTTSFLLEAQNKQLAEYEWRLNVTREGDLV